MSFLLGLTGSIGMGKSTTAGMFAEAGVPVWDADATVHKLYAPGGDGAYAIAKLVPEAVDDTGVRRDVLRAAIAKDAGLLPKIEAAIHPMVTDDREAFIARHYEPILVFEVPLLFETKAENWFDAVAIVSTSAETQRARVLERPGMTEETFALILSKQLPDAVNVPGRIT